MAGFVVWFTGLSGAGKSTLGARSGACAITAAISPYRATRDAQRARLEHFVEVYCRCSIPVLAERDAKGLYKKALAGEIQHFTGIDDPYEPPESPELSIYPAAMRYAGPREAVFHAIARKNYGCSHFIVGRDHAGVGNCYGAYDAQKIFGTFAPGELGVEPLFFEDAFYSTIVGGMATEKTAPGDASTRITLSGTAVRALLSRGELPPPELSRPEVARILVEAMRKR
jgi:ATP sulfurylase